MASVVVVGSINRDLVARVDRHPVPGETVRGSSVAMFPGGKGANQAVAAARLASARHTIRMIGRVGRDAFGDELRAFLTSENVEAAAVTESDSATGLAMITVDDAGQNMITVVSGANWDWPTGCPALALSAGDIVVCQNEIPAPIVTAAFAQARAAKATTLLNPAPFRPLTSALLVATDILVLNEIELAQIMDRSVDDVSDRALHQALIDVRARGPRAVIVTLGAAGALLLDAQARLTRVPGRNVQAIDTTGAGDCLVGALAAALLDDDDLAAALTFANAAAALSVTRHGAAASMPRRAELPSSAA